MEEDETGGKNRKWQVVGYRLSQVLISAHECKQARKLGAAADSAYLRAPQQLLSQAKLLAGSPWTNK